MLGYVRLCQVRLGQVRLVTWHDGIGDQGVLRRNLVLLSLVEVFGLGLDAGPMHQKGVVQDHEVVIQNAKLVALKDN